MGTRYRVCAMVASLLVLPPAACWAQPSEQIEVAEFEGERSRARVAQASLEGRPGLAVVFEGTSDLHFYAKSETAPAPGMQLKIAVTTPEGVFGEAVFPKWSLFYDPGLEKNVEVYVGNFTVFLPQVKTPDGPLEVTVTVAGLACTSKICLAPFTHELTVTYDPQASPQPVRLEQTTEPHDEQPPVPVPAEASGQVTSSPTVAPLPTPVYFLLAIAAGISINIMPCVLPVIPLIILRLVNQSKSSGASRVTSGPALCAGIVLFFVAFAALAAAINLATGSVLDLNSLFRYPSAVIVLFLAILFFALVMLDLVTLVLPASISNRQGSGSGVLGSIGMGFFAGVLSTPCSGALLGFVLVWAQTQPLSVSSTAIILMGVGMALPYAVIVAIPSLLDRVPKPGPWMDVFKKSMGFLLLLIAVKLTLAALPKERLLNVLTYGVVFSFCVWMWGRWVSFSTPRAKKWTVRLIALVLAVAAGGWLLPGQSSATGPTIDWRPYDALSVAAAQAKDQPVLLKFTADWCTNCKVVERKVYRDVCVVELVKKKGMLAVKADTTTHDLPATKDFKGIYGEAGNVPVTIVLDGEGQQYKLRGMFDKQELIDIIEGFADATE